MWVVDDLRVEEIERKGALMTELEQFLNTSIEAKRMRTTIVQDGFVAATPAPCG